MPASEIAAEDGRVILTVTEGETAVSVAAWYYRDQPVGVLVAHSPRPFTAGQRPCPCSLCGRNCYLAEDLGAGIRIARTLLGARYNPDGAIAAAAEYCAVLAGQAERQPS